MRKIKIKPIHISVDKSFYDIIERERRKQSKKSRRNITQPQITKILATRKIKFVPLKKVIGWKDVRIKKIKKR